MDLKQIEYFTAIVEEGSINRAAKRLGMTQPPVSKQMQLLEEELGCPLFVRSSKPLELTQEGRILYERGITLLAMAKGVGQAVKECRHVNSGTLRIGLVSSVSEMAVRKFISPFSRKYPGVSYELFEANTYELLARLKSRQFDLALVRTPYPTHALVSQELPRGDMLAVWNKKYFDLSDTGEKGDRLTVDFLSDKPLIVYRRWEKLVEEAFMLKGISYKTIALTDCARTGVTIAKEGLGVALVPDSMEEAARLEGLLVRKISSPLLQSKIALVHPEGGLDTPVCQAFWQFFAEYKKEMEN